MDNVNITFIGCGNMGRSLIGGLIYNGYPANLVTGTDIDNKKRELTAGQFSIETSDDNALAVKDADVIVIAVKPQSVKETLQKLQHQLAITKPLIISIAAGIGLKDITHWSGAELAVVRVMPNTPALVNSGAAALCGNRFVNPAQHEVAEMIMRSVGITIWVQDEKLMNAVTALSGSGPAYFFYFMEQLQKTGIELGLSNEQARLLTLETALGAAKMALESDHDLQTLRKHVTSPGGTTEAALRVLQKGKLEALVGKAMRAAYERSEELGRVFGEKK
jgi:pyrroline-5-carboxylate reductase